MAPIGEPKTLPYAFCFYYYDVFWSSFESTYRRPGTLFLLSVQSEDPHQKRPSERDVRA